MNENDTKPATSTLRSRIEGDLNTLSNQVLTREILTLFARTGIDAVAILSGILLILYAAAGLSFCIHPDTCERMEIWLISLAFGPVCFLGSAISTYFTRLPLRHQGPALCSAVLLVLGSILFAITDRYLTIAGILLIVLIGNFSGYRYGIRLRSKSR